MEAICEVAGVTTATAEEVVREAREGSVAAFERLYRENAGRVYALCLRLSGDAARAEELTQDVFVRAWERLESFRGESAVTSRLHRVAVNVVLAQRRSEGRRNARVALVEDIGVVETEGRPPASMAERMDLDAAIATLPDATRTVFVMHDVEGYTHDEIARMTGRAEGTCKALLHRARRALRERLR
jgi:RNA polymerase sigma-70 factor (ECF subfamily)